MFQDLPSQMDFLRGWVAEMKFTGTQLLLCDGNHDFNSVPVPLSPSRTGSLPGWADFVERAYRSEHWMDALMEEGAFVVGGMVKMLPELDGLIVSSLFDGRQHEEGNVSLMKEAWSLRRKSAHTPWIVLHHQPPVGLLADEKFGNATFGGWIEEYQPKIVFCGHDHWSPASTGTCCEQIGLSWVVNPGYQKENAYPCCVEIDTVTMNYQWLR
jgi:hypothetical protein